MFCKVIEQIKGYYFAEHRKFEKAMFRTINKARITGRHFVRGVYRIGALSEY